LYEEKNADFLGVQVSFFFSVFTFYLEAIRFRRKPVRSSHAVVLHDTKNNVGTTI
jgi:hypothetical protein